MSEAGKLLIFGAGGHGKVILDAALKSGWECLGFADDDPRTLNASRGGYPVRIAGRRGAIELCRREGASLVLAIGDNRARADAAIEMGGAGAEYATVVHPSAVIGRGVVLGRGTVVFAGAVINPDAWIGDQVIVNTAASVDHDCRIETAVHLSPRTVLGGSVSIGPGTHVGVGATLRDGVRVGAWSLIGAGAVVVNDIDDGVVAFGVPARRQRTHLR